MNEADRKKRDARILALFSEGKLIGEIVDLVGCSRETARLAIRKHIGSPQRRRRRDDDDRFWEQRDLRRAIAARAARGAWVTQMEDSSA